MFNDCHFSSCPDPSTSCGWAFYNSAHNNSNILTGALVGGPDLLGQHVDVRNNENGNSVAIDYNAGFQSALAGANIKYKV